MLQRQVRVRPAELGDGETLARFNRELALETEGRELDGELVRRGVLAVLSDAQRGCYRVAELGSESVGCLLVTREWSDWRNGWFWWIQSVYVAPHARRCGVYRALHDHVLASARAQGDVCGIRLYVENENLSAQAVYARLGLARTRYAMFELALAPPA